MYDDIIQSLQKALATQKWIEGDQFHRIGQPFEWIDAGITPGHRQLSELASMLPHFTMIYEEYPTPQEIVTLDFDNVRNDIRSIMIDVFRSYFPFLNLDDYTRYFDATALTRAQDYGFIKSFSGLTERLRHLDIGPGLGSHAFYSLKAFDSLFFGLEAYPQTYQVQRNVFRILSNSSEHLYLDLIATESFGFQDREASEILSKHNQGIVHIPSWKFPIIEQLDVDLFWNSASFQEMEPDVVDNYIKYVNQNARHIYLCGRIDGKEIAEAKGKHGVLKQTTLENIYQGLLNFNCINMKPLTEVDMSRLDVYLRMHFDQNKTRGYSESFWARK